MKRAIALLLLITVTNAVSLRRSDINSDPNDLEINRVVHTSYVRELKKGKNVKAYRKTRGKKKKTLKKTKKDNKGKKGKKGNLKNDEIKNGPNIIVMQPDDFPFFAEWSPPPKNPKVVVEVGGGKKGGGKKNTRSLQNTSSKKDNREFAERFPNGYGMPNLERLRTQGMQMMQAYTASSACSPSRLSTLTGRYPSRVS